MGALIFIAKVTTDYYWNDKIILQCTYYLPFKDFQVQKIPSRHII